MQPKQAINDFVIKFANVNGTGSASANGMFAKAIFRMGIPVSPRNIGYTDLMVDWASSPHQPDTTLRWLIDRPRS